MKKRLLALALCLVMAVSLLPLTAAAETQTKTFKSLHIKGEVKGSYGPYIVDCSVRELRQNDGTAVDLTSYYIKDGNGFVIDNPPDDGKTYYITFFKDYEGGDTISVEWDESFFANINIPGYITKLEDKTATISPNKNLQLNFKISLTKEREHLWQFTQTENSLKATCQSCDIAPMSVTLTANSVTLPENPFNAQVILNGITEEQIREEFGYEISPIRYKFKAPGDSAFTEITPADGAREGTYQAAVTLSPISTTFSARSTADPNSVTLYTQYTAVNPETTAQTGDNRPIELMMASAAVFSALAAAAFALDSKRRSQQ